MTLLSFIGTTSQGPFWQQILLGKKVQTCRLPRKVPIKVGDRLHLYWMVRVPPAEKPIHKIAEAICTSVLKMQYEDFAWDDEFAVRDGFRDHRELQRSFGSPVVFGYEMYDVISWSQLECGIACIGCPVLADCPRVSEANLLAWEHEQEQGVVGKSATEQWLVRSRKTGVVCHISESREDAKHWADKFLGEHGEVITE